MIINFYTQKLTLYLANSTPTYVTLKPEVVESLNFAPMWVDYNINLKNNFKWMTSPE